MKDIEGETRGGQENTYRKNVSAFPVSAQKPTQQWIDVTNQSL